MPAPSASTTPAAAGVRINVLRSLRAHRAIAAAAFVSVCSIALPFAYWKGKPSYYAEAVVYVSPRFVKTLQEDKEFDLPSNSQYREFVQQNVRTINRYDIVLEAGKKLGLRGVPWKRPKESEQRAAELLQSRLEVRPVPDTYQITVGLEGDKPDGLAEIVNTVTEVYLSRQRDEDFYATDQRIASLRQERTKLENEIETNEELRNKLSQDIGVSTFTENFQNPFDKVEVDHEEALAEARRKRFEAESQFSAIDESRGREAKAALQAIAGDLAARDANVMSLQASLNQRRAELVGRISGLAPDHPGRKAVERELGEIDQSAKAESDLVIRKYANSLVAQRRAELYKAKQVEQALTVDFARKSSEASSFASKYQRGLALGLVIERARKHLDAIDDRINFLSLESAAPGFVRMFSKARKPEVPTKGGRKKLALAGMGLAFFLALALPVAIDLLDPRIHSAEDVKRLLGFPPAGWLPEKDHASPGFYRNKSLRLAAAIQRQAEGAGSKIVLFTSAKPNGGTTTLAWSAANELCQAGVNTLLVEVNAFAPDSRYASADGVAECTLAKLIRGECRIPPPRADAPVILPVGDLSGERHLPQVSELTRLLREAAAGYSVILLDAPPILLSADAEFLAHAADIVLLVIEANRVTTAEVKRAARALENAQPEAIGAVVNRVRIYSDSGYYRAALEEFDSGRRKSPTDLMARWFWS